MSTITFEVPEVHEAIDADRVLRIRGGRSLRGEVRVRGAKNTLPKNMVAALLTDQECVLRNVSGIRDVEIVGRMIRALGGGVEHTGSGEVKIRAADLEPLSREDAAEFSGRSRIPVLLCGPLLNRVGELFIPDLGGCNIGPRPIDFHLEALAQLGAVVHETSDGVRLTAPGRLHGARIRLPYPSVGATEQVLLSAVLAQGVTELSNAAIEPEIIDLIAVLQKMGATISVETDRVITINGVEQMHGFEHSALPDRLETASWACAALATDGRIFVAGAHQLDMMTFLNAFRRVGGDFRVGDEGIEFWRAGPLRSVALETDVHPGFMTDWQQPFVVALTQAEGVSIVHETVYEDRFGYTSALNDMGAQIQLYRECLGGRSCRFGQRNHRHSAVIVGPTPLRGTEINIPDLRAGFSYVIAALVADGLSTVTNVGLIRRGYEHFEDKLLALGADLIG